MSNEASGDIDKASLRFERSLTSLARIALKETAATGYALFHNATGVAGLTKLSAVGEPVDARALIEPGAGDLLAFPLHTQGATDGFAVFAFTDRDALSRSAEPLGRIVEAMELVWGARRFDAHYLNLARRIGALESKLIDPRIADRVNGLLDATPDKLSAVDAVVNHVRSVLRPGEPARTIETAVERLEVEIEERRITGQAKALLQAAHSMSEEQAYTYLRGLSRKTRRPLKEVAADVMAQHTLTARSA